jgi:hypothetical protein
MKGQKGALRPQQFPPRRHFVSVGCWSDAPFASHADKPPGKKGFADAKNTSTLLSLYAIQSIGYVVNENGSTKGAIAMKKVVVLALVLCFGLSTVGVFADQYLIVKDKSGKCKLEVFKADKGSIIAGPFDSKEEGVKALHEKCPEAAKKPAEKKTDKK